ncbi:isoprenoid biosynthesis glyoxalase ElbB [Alkalitalea saponilacus]|uniref:Enhancing lycopene biosynthesis protein 2 n=1 Tax=Alkalitalea saponilacus TaxID=889453 RepID=A0A1T5EPZ4_9BACT|nr:isoprenoid biosynthesis glyoxalase ElbB [Alkalitalea saponilacus]ASB48063.1 isoprenoid biosynthesis protein ElbB [Alkalitalea saponilacus]SKB85985.1 Enhancing lycopene biosynthesis protein 2 [Alkalitalea saponilacus]
MTKKKIAVILAGCGVYDGAEIHESVLTMLAIQQAGAEYELFAPDIEQHHVVNHISGEEMNEKRNVLIEAARIARGNIKPLSELKVENADALMIPGGFGVAKNLCSFAVDGPDCKVNPEAELVVKSFHKAGKPIGALCISPALITKVLGAAEVTIGSDEGTAAAINKMGGTHVNTTHGEVIIDKKNKIATTPCYMLDATITQIAEGAGNIVKTVLKMI